MTTSDIPPPFDTIAAIATPPGVGGLGIVRVSGPNAFAIGRALFRPARAQTLTDTLTNGFPSARHLTYGHVIDAASGEVVDEVMAVFLPAPRTFTAEDTLELSAHGSPLVLRRILALILAAGARAARPGEMTERAFLHGRIDLAQAEAVLALINAETEAGRRLALRQLQGALSERVRAAQQAAQGALVRIEASIDFPEEEVPAPDRDELARLTAEARGEVATLLAGADRGRVLREGLRVALVGRPNVGKSSLLNTLLGTERAIVTPIAGTTRDTIEERAIVGGIPLYLVDTAGLSASADPIERLGVERSRQAAASADLWLLILDGSLLLNPRDAQAADELRALAEERAAEGVPAPGVLLVLNKADLPQAVDVDEAATLWPGARVVRTSALTADGVAELEAAIAQVTERGEARAGEVLVSSARHQDALRRASDALAAAAGAIASGLPLDLVAIDLREALSALGEITGETASADLLDRIFAEFCIGK